MGTIRQAVLASGIAEGMSITEAGQLAGYHSVQNASDAFRGLRAKLIEDLADVGVSTRAIAVKIKEKMAAQETKLFQKDGYITDAIDLEAHGIQLQATELAADIMGLRGGKDSNTSIGTVNILWAGASPAWTGHSSDASVTGAIPCQASDASVNAEANASLTSGKLVHPDNQTVTGAEGVPTSTIEGTGLGPPPPTHAHCSSSGDRDALTQRIVKKRKPRLPVYKGRGK